MSHTVSCHLTCSSRKVMTTATYLNEGGGAVLGTIQARYSYSSLDMTSIYLDKFEVTLSEK
jgi:hypothetical protein